MPRILIFHLKILASAKLRRSLSKKVYFLELHICAYLSTRLQVFCIFLTSFRQNKCKNEPVKSPPWLGLNDIIENENIANVKIFSAGKIFRRELNLPESFWPKYEVSNISKIIKIFATECFYVSENLFRTITLLETTYAI